MCFNLSNLFSGEFKDYQKRSINKMYYYYEDCYYNYDYFNFGMNEIKVCMLFLFVSSLGLTPLEHHGGQ